MTTRRRRPSRAKSNAPKKPKSVVLKVAQAKVVRALARDRQRTVEEANRMLAEAEAAMRELAETYATLYGLACEEGERFDFEPAEDEIVLKAVPKEPEPPAPDGEPAGGEGEPEQQPETGPEGGGGEDLKGVRMSRDKGIAGWVATHQQPLIIDDVNTDDRYYQSIAQSFDFKPTSLLCVPMASHNRLIGVLQVMHNVPGRYFDSLDRQLLTTFGNQAAIAIENARLYESLKEGDSIYLFF